MNEEELTNALTELAGSDASLPELCSFAGDVLGKDAGRIQAKTLDFVARYVSKFDHAEHAQEWISERDLRLAAWTSCQCVRWAIGELPERISPTDKRALEFAEEMIETIESSLRREAENIDLISRMVNDGIMSIDLSPRSTLSAPFLDLLVASSEAGVSVLQSSRCSAAPSEGFDRSTSAVSVVRATASSVASVGSGSGSEKWHVRMGKNFRLLVGVIAEAIRAYPA